MARFDHAAQLHAKGLLAIANRENGNAQLPNDFRRAGASGVQRRTGASGKNDALGVKGFDLFFGAIERMNLAVNASFTNASRNQLRDLGSEIEDEDGVGHWNSFPSKESRIQRDLQKHGWRPRSFIMTGLKFKADDPMPSISIRKRNFLHQIWVISEKRGKNSLKRRLF
jgi:hypothetical protein